MLQKSGLSMTNICLESAVHFGFGGGQFGESKKFQEERKVRLKGRGGAGDSQRSEG